MPKFSDAERYAFLKKFNDMDANKDGSLTANEIRKCLEASHLQSNKINVCFGFYTFVSVELFLTGQPASVHLF